MALAFDRLEQRILGVLVEKEATTPEAYPLTLNALVAGCNQRNNRDPQMNAEPYEVEGALRSLMDRDFVVRMERAGGRTERYEHCLREQLAVEAADLALLAELLNRGPQTPGELRTRAHRMHPFASPAAVEARLGQLAARPVPYVRRLERRPREHAPRWTHLFAKAPAAAAGPEVTAPLGVPEHTASAGAPEPPAAAPAPAPDLDARLAALERAVEALRDRLDRLEERSTG